MNIKAIATTQDTGETVYKASEGDAYATVIPTGDFKGHSCILIHHVAATDEVRMKDLLNAVTERFDKRLLVFVTILNPSLADKLDGFTRANWTTPRGTTDVLVGRWRPRQTPTNSE